MKSDNTKILAKTKTKHSFVCYTGDDVKLYYLIFELTLDEIEAFNFHEFTSREEADHFYLSLLEERTK